MTGPSPADAALAGTIEREADRRRTVAVIAHPDAGKSTLTESLTLAASAIDEAGAVKGKATRRATVSDWMEIERSRGISISSAVVQLDAGGTLINVVDTPGHADFSEDTYRALAAVDCAVMLIDAAKGMEAQTIRLFEVCRTRDIPVIAVVNKWDRPGREALDLLDELEERTGRAPTPVTWPVGEAGNLQGLVDTATETLTTYESTGGGHLPVATERPAAEAAELFGSAWETALEEVELTREVRGLPDQDDFHARVSMPVFFGVATKHLGTVDLLRFLRDTAPPALPRRTEDGAPRPVTEQFAAQVFKVQANMDPAHHDQVAFVRICSGRFDRGMMLTHAQSGRRFNTKHALSVFGRERDTVDVAWPGDVVGLVNATMLHPGDTLYSDEAVEFEPLPRFAPEMFATVAPTDPSTAKKFRKGMQQLAGEGVVQLLESERRTAQAPMVGVIGSLQLEVLTSRLQAEFATAVRVEPLPWTMVRTVTDSDLTLLERRRDLEIVTTDRDRYGLFRDQWHLNSVMRELKGLELPAPV